MRIYDVVNKARCGFWCAAPDAEAAITIALQAKHARKRENLHALDVTENFEACARGGQTGISEILSGDRTGRIYARMTGHTWDEIMSGTTKPAQAHWQIVRRAGQ